jgi:hypothetical protein
MNRAKTAGQRINGIRRLCAELDREDSQLRSHLLEAALAGLRLTRYPQSQGYQSEAVRVWKSIEPTLSLYLATKDPVMMPQGWELYSRISPEVLFRIHECHSKLKRLGGALENPGQVVTERIAIEAGRVLCGLAVCLDDAIESEERKIFPAIHKALCEKDRSV